MSHIPPVHNKLLAALHPVDYARLAPALELVSLSARQVLYEPNQVLTHAYFPLNSIISLFNVMEAGQRVEATMVGPEGMVGIPLVLGTNQIPMQAVVRMPGSALRLSASALRAELQVGSPLYSRLLRYVQTLISQISQNLACTRLHSPEERCCYLLALIQDRVGANEFSLSQETLAQLVGVRRADLNPIVTNLERAGLIQRQRGRIEILDRPNLEAASCDCYPILKSEFDRLLQD